MNLSRNESNKTQFYDDINIEFDIDHLFRMINIPITLFGTFTNLINITIFSNKEFKDRIFTYLLVHSIAEFFYLFLCNFLPLPYCGVYCDFTIRNAFVSILIMLIIEDYLTSCIAIFNILLEIFISLQRYSLLSSTNCFGFNRLNSNSTPYYVVTILLIISSLYYSPIFFLFEIVQIDDSLIPLHLRTNGEKYYEKVSTKFSNDHKSFQLYYELIINFIRGPICMAILTLINLLTLLKFRKQIKKKIQIKSTILIKSYFSSFNF
jgi:hypothetical protein